MSGEGRLIALPRSRQPYRQGILGAGQRHHAPSHVLCRFQPRERLRTAIGFASRILDLTLFQRVIRSESIDTHGCAGPTRFVSRLSIMPGDAGLSTFQVRQGRVTFRGPQEI